MRPALMALALTASSAGAVPGDLNLDGIVDFEDFYILADNFGRSGPPDTLRVVVLDTLQVETVYDTVTVEFVPAPGDVNVSEPSQVIRDGYSGPPVEQIVLSGYISPNYNSVGFRAMHREPIDSEDNPSLLIDSDVRVVASVDVRYVALSATTDLTVAEGDSLRLLRQVFLLREIYQYGEGRIEYDPEEARYPEWAGSVGEVRADIVLRTPHQGDHAIRLVQPAQVSANGKITR